MSSRPEILLSYTFPPESPGTVEDFAAVLRDIDPDLNLERAANRADFIRKAPNAEIVIEHGLPEAVIERGRNLQWIQSLSAGINRYPREVLEEREIILTTASGAHAPAIAQQTIGYLLLFERDFTRALDQARDREWRRFPARELTDNTIGIVGVGAVGGKIADLATAFEMEVLGIRRHSETPHPSVDRMYAPDDLHTVLSESDYVVLACPLTPETRGLIDDEAFSTMRTGTILINVSRGAVVDQTALTESLTSGELRGAALDVVDPEPLPRDSVLWDLSNVVITPHNAGGSQHFPQRCAKIFHNNYDKYVDGDYESMINRAI